MNRASELTALDMSIGEDLCRDFIFLKVKCLADFEISVFYQMTKWNALFFGRGDVQTFKVRRFYGCDSFLCYFDVVFIFFYANKISLESFCNSTCSSTPKKWVKDNVTNICTS